VKLGMHTLTPLDAGTFRYDGGAMFGVVPRVIWGRLLEPDEENRILLSIVPLLIETPTRRILVDTGLGERLTKRDRKVFGLSDGSGVAGALRAHGVAPEDVDVVVLTHLHIDHAGGAVVDRSGALSPAFPNARYIVHELEWKEGHAPNAMNEAAYRRDDFDPLRSGGVLDIIDSDETSLGEGISLVRTGGHCAGHLMVVVESGGETAVYPADLVPTRHHFRAPYTAGVDVYPLEVIERKEQLLRSAADGGWTLILDHDPAGSVGRVVRDEKGRYRFEDMEVPE
jgi:glyoxylase-like metal-dependent hydrolase (beta-lactamase superfamily II)